MKESYKSRRDAGKDYFRSDHAANFEIFPGAKESKTFDYKNSKKLFKTPFAELLSELISLNALTPTFRSGNEETARRSLAGQLKSLKKILNNF